MAAGGVRWYNYTGEDDEVPRDATHITVDKSVRVIPAWAFYDNRSIVEVVCDFNVKGVEIYAFKYCESLRRVIMPGVESVESDAFYRCVNLTDVECGKLEIIKNRAFEGCKSLGSINLPSAKIVERSAFHNCKALTDIECGKLEIIKQIAFSDCTSLGNIDLPSARIVERNAFWDCETLADAKFGDKLERIEERAFYGCPSLERITIPLKDGIITPDYTFKGFENLKHVDLVEGELHETIAALQLEEWRIEMNEEIDSINRILPTLDAGGWDVDEGYLNEGGKAQAIRLWIRSVIGKIIHHQAEHQRLLDEEVATTLQLALPRDIVMNNVLPFLELPSYTF